ncbi:unnamed protein product [Malus baccata var. baccata]
MLERNIASWNAMILGLNMIGWRKLVGYLKTCRGAIGYVENGKFDEARELYGQMPEKNAVAMTAMLTVYS